MSASEFTAAERLERLPLSSYHRLLLFIIALAFFFDSMDLAMMTFMLGSIKAEFGLTTTQTGLMASASFVGMAVGAALSGMLADRFGRRPVFMWSIVVWGVASALCAIANDATSLTLYRILLGFGMGMEFPIAQALLSEFIPARYRGRYMALLDGFWPVGFIAAGTLSYFLLPVVGWRMLFLILAVPAVIVLVIRRWLPESPRWLEQAGHLELSRQTTELIERNVMASLGVQHLPQPRRSAEAVLPELTFMRAFHQLWAPLYWRRTVMVWGLWFFALLGFYGLASWLSVLLQSSGFPLAQSLYYTVIISLGGIPGFIFTAWAVEALGRKPTCLITLIGGGLMAYIYGHVAIAGVSQVALISAGLAMQFFLFGMFAVLYTWTPELYPTGARATGSGFASAIGRVGSLIGPTATGLVLPLAGQSGVFSLGALCFGIAALIVLVLGVETRGRTLEELTHSG